MGFFDLFTKKSALDKHAERVANRRAQAPDRWESIQILGKMATAAPPGSDDQRALAIAALMERFTFYVDPTITDGEEKDEVFRWITEAGDLAIDPVRMALRKHQSSSWPLRCLEHLLSEERITEVMIELLGTMDTEYERDPQRKIQVLSTLEERAHPHIAKAVAPFFLDANETARYHAAGAALAQENAEARVQELLDALVEEESVRVKMRVLDAMAERGWSLGAKKDLIELPQGYATDSKGVPRRAK